jgi:hypothetical protein
MARIRTVKPSIATNEDLASLPFSDRYAFILLWGHCDRRGRVEDRPKRLKALTLPYDDIDFDAVLSRLNESGFIIRYEVDGVRLIQVTKFEKNQRITGAEAQTESEFPPPPGFDETEENQTGNNGETTETTGKGKGKGKGRGKEAASAAGGATDFVASPTDVADESPVVLTFRTTGKQAEWHLRQAFVDELSQLYPQLDPLAECKKAHAKIEAGAVTRKTANGMKRFLFSWMDRGTNGKSAYAGRAPPPQSPQQMTDAERRMAGGNSQ